MVYKEEYAIAILQDGKIVPERDGAVNLAYGSEYAIRLKNKSRVRSAADVYIDGTIAAKGVVVEEDGTIDLERYIRPGKDSASGGPRYKVARLDNPGVADSNDDQNGLVEVRFYKEAPRARVDIHEHHHHHHDWTITRTPAPDPWPAWRPYPWGLPISYCDTKVGGAPEPSSTIMSSITTNALHTKSTDNWNTLSKRQAESLRGAGPAATVQGGLSQQRVENVTMDLDTSRCVALSIRLRGVTKVTRHAKCPSCGHKRRSSEHFCPKCGSQLVYEG